MSKLAVTLDGRTFDVSLVWNPQADKVAVTVNGEVLTLKLPAAAVAFADVEWLLVNDRPYELMFDENLRWLQAYYGRHHLEVRDLDAAVTRPRSGDSRVKAPIPGLVSRILVEPGDEVTAGDPVVILEAMKMENEIRSQATGVITNIHVQPGATVLRNELLLEVR
jgi:biotin carboxyl carrier protein